MSIFLRYAGYHLPRGGSPPTPIAIKAVGRVGSNIPGPPSPRVHTLTLTRQTSGYDFHRGRRVRDMVGTSSGNETSSVEPPRRLRQVSPQKHSPLTDRTKSLPRNDLTPRECPPRSLTTPLTHVPRWNLSARRFGARNGQKSFAGTGVAKLRFSTGPSIAVSSRG